MNARLASLGGDGVVLIPLMWLSCGGGLISMVDSFNRIAASNSSDGFFIPKVCLRFDMLFHCG